MRIAIGNDHAGYELKLELKEYLEARGHDVVDYGHHSGKRADYPVYAEKVAKAVVSRQAERGILICGTGVGISIAANKVLGARCVVCSEPFSARLSREHNDTNLLAVGARVVGPGLARSIVEEWLAAEFSGGRHADRVALIDGLERH